MDKIGPYQLQGELGRGGMGIVYKALDPVIGRTVAVKTLNARDLGDPEERQKLQERLFREAKSAGILSHPGIVTIYQAGQDGDVLYIAMEYIDGPNLAQALARSRPGVDLSLTLIRQAAEALDYAHSKGVIHRDIKPGNLLLQSEGRVKVADFGIAKLAATNLTKTGTTVGSPAYMSPEQIRALPMDGRADQYSLAVVAYELLTGMRPYESETITSLVFKVVFEQPDLAQLAAIPGCAGMEPVLRKALSKSAPERYPNCTAFYDALRRAAGGSGPAKELDRTLPLSQGILPANLNPSQSPASFTPSIPLTPAIPRPVTSRRGMVMAIAAVLALIVGAGGFYLWSSSSQPRGTPLDPQTGGQQVQAPPRVSGKAIPPELLLKIKPDYTKDALRAGVQGSVTLRIGIDEQGRVEEATVIKGLDPGLDQKAIEAVKKWKFKPAMADGKPVAIQSQVELEFLIQR